MCSRSENIDFSTENLLPSLFLNLVKFLTKKKKKIIEIKTVRFVGISLRRNFLAFFFNLLPPSLPPSVDMALGVILCRRPHLRERYFVLGMKKQKKNVFTINSEVTLITLNVSWFSLRFVMIAIFVGTSTINYVTLLLQQYIMLCTYVCWQKKVVVTTNVECAICTTHLRWFSTRRLRRLCSKPVANFRNK